MKHKTAELTGALLDSAVALADGRLILADEPGWNKGDYRALREEYGGRHVVRWFARGGENCDGPETREVGGWEPIDNWGSPSTDWNLAGSILDGIDGLLMKRWPESNRDGKCQVEIHNADGDCIAFGPTLLIAGMRAFVAHKLGDEVEL